MSHIRTITATVLGLSLPAGILAWIYLGAWEHAAAGLVLALVGLVIGTAPQGRPEPSCGAKADVLFTGDAAPRRCARPPHDDANHRDSEGYGWGELDRPKRPWPDRENLTDP